MAELSIGDAGIVDIFVEGGGASPEEVVQIVTDAGFTTASDVTGIVDGALEDYVTSASLTTTLADYVTQEEYVAGSVFKLTQLFNDFDKSEFKGLTSSAAWTNFTSFLGDMAAYFTRGDEVTMDNSIVEIAVSGGAGAGGVGVNVSGGMPGHVVSRFYEPRSFPSTAPIILSIGGGGDDFAGQGGPTVFYDGYFDEILEEYVSPEKADLLAIAAQGGIGGGDEAWSKKQMAFRMSYPGGDRLFAPWEATDDDTTALNNRNAPGGGGNNIAGKSWIGGDCKTDSGFSVLGGTPFPTGPGDDGQNFNSLTGYNDPGDGRHPYDVFRAYGSGGAGSVDDKGGDGGAPAGGGGASFIGFLPGFGAQGDFRIRIFLKEPV